MTFGDIREWQGRLDPRLRGDDVHWVGGDEPKALDLRLYRHDEHLAECDQPPVTPARAGVQYNARGE